MVGTEPTAGFPNCSDVGARHAVPLPGTTMIPCTWLGMMTKASNSANRKWCGMSSDNVGRFRRSPHGQTGTRGPACADRHEMRPAWQGYGHGAPCPLREADGAAMVFVGVVGHGSMVDSTEPHGQAPYVPLAYTFVCAAIWRPASSSRY
jgi:hypothetical protein